MSSGDLNDITVATYRNNFDTYKQKTLKEVVGELKKWFDDYIGYLPKEGKVFELGSATGRDARYMREKGFDLLCTDVIPDALLELQEAGFKTASYDFRDIPRNEWMHAFDGYLADAVLLHAPKHIFDQALLYAHMVLKKGGVAMMIFKEGMGQEMIVDKLGAPRYFKYHNEATLKESVSKVPFEIISITHSNERKLIKLVMRAL